MKRSEIVKLIIEHKSEINRILAEKPKPYCVGFTLVNGKTPRFYNVEINSTRVLHTLFTAKTGFELLEKIHAFHLGLIA